MRVGLSYDLKEAVVLKEAVTDDALEEYDSPTTIEYIRRALEGLGHSVVKLGGGPDFIRNILDEKVDIVFNIAEGRGNYRSREAQVPAILEMLDIPYVGSDPECLAICLDKHLTKTLLKLEGIPTPKLAVLWSSEKRPRMAFSSAIGCSKISFSMKWAYRPISASSQVQVTRSTTGATSSRSWVVMVKFFGVTWTISPSFR